MMKSEVKEVEGLDFLTFPLLYEKKSYLLSVFVKEHLKDDLYIKKKEVLKTEIKKFLKVRINQKKNGENF